MIDPARPDAAVAVRPVTPTEPVQPVQLTSLLSRAVRASAHGVAVVDVLAGDMPLVYVNEAFQRMSGYPEADLHLAGHDALTGLPNRTTVLEELDEALRRDSRAGRGAAVLFLDLDGFKAVNDRHGHAVGDRVLVEVAERLRAGMRTCDVLARHGGDEFVAVLGDLDPLDAERVAHRAATDAVAALQRPRLIAGISARVAASVGVAVFPDAGRTSAELLRAADVAMYQAKTAGSGSVRSSRPPAVPDQRAEHRAG